jgi:hypothetical protein
MSPEFLSRFPPISSPPPPESPYYAHDPPSDLSSYARALYIHTLKQASTMSAAGPDTAANGTKPEDKHHDDDHDDHREEAHTEHIEDTQGSGHSDRTERSEHTSSST